MKQVLDGEDPVEAARVRSVVQEAAILPERVEVGCGITYPASILHMQAVVAVARFQVVLVRLVRAEQVVVVRAAKAPMEPMAHQTQAAAAAAVMLRHMSAGTADPVS
jgi:hypothetical protein